MLIWLNGPNGVGKTQVAYELHRALAGSFVCDPEHLGFALRRMLPASLRGDFRGMPLWRDGVADMLRTVLDAGAGPVVVPMTVLDPRLLAALVDPLRAAGHEVRHVTLLADRAVLLRRIRSRAETARSFAATQADHSLALLRAPEFARHLHTDGMSIDAVAADIAAGAGLAFTPDPAGPVRRRVRRLGVQLRHIRFDELVGLPR
ncbi:ATP-binding protein [Frankia gtarii]|uniref:ATP-binding protein n=1 Tax=Frankia gtarii TaxID=2950102 RepID=UPI0021C01B15|nr:ATP-binding protein [Frankia gtarii]